MVGEALQEHQNEVLFRCRSSQQLYRCQSERPVLSGLPWQGFILSSHLVILNLVSKSRFNLNIFILNLVNLKLVNLDLVYLKLVSTNFINYNNILQVQFPYATEEEMQLLEDTVNSSFKDVQSDDTINKVNDMAVTMI